ncbi:RhoGEF domain containing protein [Trichuris trichiura]|uniref:RhoGEF domain containing protein n=1 Tax=Trichuris trichiura TaxID=36087 RepID=A0A077ZG52_TRITR|nr:RhoGEF domain containing protein [Trichuris trichiura]
MAVASSSHASWPNLCEVTQRPVNLSKSLVSFTLSNACLRTIEQLDQEYSALKVSVAGDEPCEQEVANQLSSCAVRRLKEPQCWNQDMSSELPLVCLNRSQSAALLTKVGQDDVRPPVDDRGRLTLATALRRTSKSDDTLARAGVSAAAVALSTSKLVATGDAVASASALDLFQDRQPVGLERTKRFSLGTFQSKPSVSNGLGAQVHLAQPGPVTDNLQRSPEGTELLKFVDEGISLDRTFSVPSIEDHVEPEPPFTLKHRENAVDASIRERTRQIRASSMVVPAITPRLPLMGLLPKAVGRPVDKADLKSKDKALKLRCSKKHAKTKERKAHFWMAVIEKCLSTCEVCGKPNGDFYQCNDCAIVVHVACKASVEKQPCASYASKTKPPSKHSSLVFPTRPLSIVSRFSSLRSEIGSSVSSSSCSSDAATPRNNLASSDVLSFLPDGAPVYSTPDIEWTRVGLWSDDNEAETWSTGPGKAFRSQLSSKEVKRQDIIYELFVTEKHHCTTLVILKHTYFDGLLELEILSEEDLSVLMPNLDVMLEIHLRFLQNLKKLMDESVIVSEIDKAFLDLFTGELSQKMRMVYTFFCAQKESSVKEYHRLCSTNANFQYFVDNLSKSSHFKTRSLPDCLLLITQRLSKYHSFVESLRKSTTDPAAKEGMIKAEQAVKKLIADVDAGIGLIQLQQLRQKLVAQMDPKESTSFLGKPFTRSDLNSSSRELLYASEVSWQTARRKPIEVSMLLFTDVIVFLHRNSQSYSFCTQDNKEGIISLQKLIVREKAGRMGSQGLYLISTAPCHAEMYEILFHTKKNLAAWTERIQRAVDSYSAPGRRSSKIAAENISDENQEQLKFLFGKAAEANEHIKDCLDEQIETYKSILDLVGEISFGEDDKTKKLLHAVEECLTTNVADSGAAKLAELMSQLFRDQCVQQLLGAASVGSSQPAPINSSEAAINRSQTFHELYRKHVTVSGIPSAIDKSRSMELFEHNYPESRANSKSHLFTLLAKLNDAEFEIKRLKQEKAQLLLEQEKEKNLRNSCIQTAYSAGLEELRKLHAELEKRRADFQQLIENRTAELNAREKEIGIKSASMERDSADFQNKLDRLRGAWEKLQVTTRTIPGSVKQSANTVDNLVQDFSEKTDNSLPNPQSSEGRKPSVPPYLLGSFVHGGRLPEDVVRQQLPSKLVKDDMVNSLSSKIPYGIKDRKKPVKGKEQSLASRKKCK